MTGTETFHAVTLPLPENVLAAVHVMEFHEDVHAAWLHSWEDVDDKTTLLDVARLINSIWVDKPHLLWLAEKLTEAVLRVEGGENARLVISMPPGHGKSTLTVVALLVWLIKRHPEWMMAIISVEGPLATKWSREVRRPIAAGVIDGVMLASDVSTVTEWETSAGGGVVARGVGGSMVGRHVKVMVIDDPVKNAKQAHSEDQREALRVWWRGIGAQRLDPPSLAILVMTRWHEDDLAATLLGDGWDELRLPAIAGPNDPMGREEGDPLFSPVLPHETREEALERLASDKAAVGSYAWSGQYQQEPAPPKGQVFDVGWWQYWAGEQVGRNAEVAIFSPTRFGEQPRRWTISWDMAFKGAEDSDLVVGQVWCAIGADRYLVDQVRERMTFTETLASVKALSARWPWITEILVEDKANGTAVIDVLKKVLAGMIPVNPTDSKLGRAQSCSPVVEAGNVYLPHPSVSPWVDDYINEFRFFPHGTNDDQVDATTQYLNRLNNVMRKPTKIHKAAGSLPR